MTTENNKTVSCLQRDTVEQEGYAEALSDTTTQLEEQNGVMLLKRILHRDSLNEAFKRVKRNKGGAGADDRTNLFRLQLWVQTEPKRTTSR